MDTMLLRSTYQEEYGLERLPSEREALRIGEIERQRKYCEESCRDIRECQFKGADRGFKPLIMADDLNRFKGKHLYFGKTKCAKELELERVERERRSIESANLPIPRALRESQRALIEGLKRGNYYIVGGHGSGKTNLLAHIGLKYLREGASVRYVSQPELLTELRVGSERYWERLRECKEAEVLLIDDWRGRESRYNEEQLWVIMNHREMRGKVSIIGSREGLEEQSSRLRERLEGYRVELLIPHSTFLIPHS